MNIKISKFLSINNVDFSINKGLNLLIGKNGSGKTQVLVALAQKRNHKYLLLQHFGYEVNDDELKKILEGINIMPMPSLVFYREAIRKMNDGQKSNHYATISPISDYIYMADIPYGYTFNVQNRFINVYSIIVSLYMGGNLEGADSNNVKNWNIITTKFNEVFSKEIICKFDPSKGAKLGIKLKNGDIASINSLSTGEIEFLSLLCDLIIEKDNNMQDELILIDELDSHFHPDLQKKL